MKTKIAMAISIAGVLVAGSAAALVNTQVLGNNTSTTPVLADNGQVSQQTDPTTVTVPAAVTVGTTPAVVETTPTTVAVPPPAAVTSQAVYTAGDGGTVTLDTTGDVLTIVGVVPTAGWTVTKSENEDATNVEVKFQNGTVEVEFHANLQFGIVSPSVETKDDAATSNSVDDNGSGRHGGNDDGGGHGGDDD
jgi:hypothetical protein